MTRRRQFKRPVFSRLTLAWALFACAGAAFAGYSWVNGRDAAEEKIALVVKGDVERIARPHREKSEARPTLRSTTGVTLAAADKAASETAISSSTADNENADTDTVRDVYADLPTLVSVTPDEDPIGPLEESAASDTVIITIDGAPARQPGQQLAVIKPVRTDLSPGALVVKPITGLLQKTIHGEIPKIGKNGERAARLYAKPYRRDKDKPQIAIVIGGLGLNAALTERAIDELPANITLAFAPYAKNLDRWIEKARNDGHEIVIELPMEAHGGSAAALGPAALLTNRSEAENLERLNWILSRFKGYFAATNYLGGKFSADPKAMRPIMKKLGEAGVAYIDDTGAIRRNGAKGEWAMVNRMITPGSDGKDTNAVKRDLDALEKIASRDGNALGKTFAYEVSINEIRDWTEKLSERGYAIAPASSVLRTRARGI